MSNLFRFRKYKKTQGKKKLKHPKLIVDDYDSEFGFMGLTSSKSKGKKHKNIPLHHNPQEGNSKQAYLRRKIEYDNKKMFGEILSNYKLSDDDMDNIVSYVAKRKKKR